MNHLIESELFNESVDLFYKTSTDQNLTTSSLKFLTSEEYSASDFYGSVVSFLILFIFNVIV